VDRLAGTTRLVSISVDDELGRRGATNEAVVEGALEVAEDALYNSEMGLTGVVHVKAHLLHRVDDVRSRKVRYQRALPTLW
jgi:hypothetical protein